LQNLIDDMYIQFVEFVAEGRKLDFDEAKSVSGMRLGRKDAGTKTLIDKPGTPEERLKRQPKKAKISGEPLLVHPLEPKACRLSPDDGLSLLPIPSMII